MSIQKHEIPILEFDSDPRAVLEPGHEALDVHFPERAVFAFLQDTIEKYALQHGGKILTHFLSATMQYPIFLLEENGIPFLLVQAPVGARPCRTNSGLAHCPWSDESHQQWFLRCIGS